MKFPKFLRRIFRNEQRNEQIPVMNNNPEMRPVDQVPVPRTSGHVSMKLESDEFGFGQEAGVSVQYRGLVLSGQHEIGFRELEPLVESELVAQVYEDFSIEPSLVCLGAGSFGQVYEATSRADNGKSVLKIQQAKSANEYECRKAHRLCHNEAKILALLDHSNIVKLVHHVFYKLSSSDQYAAYFVMQFEQCRTDLEKFLQRNVMATPEDFLNVFRQIGSALEYVHSKHIAHHDIKPGNLMILDINEPLEASHFQYKIIDFGLARKYPAVAGGLDKVVEDQYCGTRTYMCLEKQLEEPYNPFKSDVYALGLTLLRCLTGTCAGRFLTAADEIHALRGQNEVLKVLDPSIRTMMVNMVEDEERYRPQMEQVMACLQ